MFHANYYEPTAQLRRASEKAHYATCAECGGQVCGQYALYSADADVACSYNGYDCAGGFLNDSGKVVCSYCE